MPARTNTELPLDIYIPFVRTLFRDGVTLAVGITAQSFLAVIVFIKTGHPIYLAIAAAILGIGAMRLASVRRVNAAPPPETREDARRLENIYIAWGTAHAIGLGAFCFAGIYAAHDQFAEIASVCVTLATATSIAGRNYGSPRMVMVLIFFLTMPISAGFLMRGDVFHVLLGFLSIPFFFAIRRFAGNVRDVLFAAVFEEKKANKLAQRFDRALNTMSHGLVMLGPDGKVVVANAEATLLLRKDDPRQLLGRSLRAVLMRGVAGGLISLKDSRYAESQLTRALKESRNRKLQLRLTDGRYFEFSARPGNDELGVITFEEVTARVEAEARIRHMARYDSLTNLPNRAYFHELVAELVAGGDMERSCALAVFDLDDFKSINDTLGHPVGDGLISAVAEKLSAIASDDVTVSRFGGDEFMIFVNSIGGEEELALLLDRIFADLSGYVDVAGHALRVQMSAGAVISTVGATDVDDMIVKADLALYKVKESGKNGWRLFEAKMNAAFRNRQMMKSDLRGAVEARDLRVVYQPIVSMETMRIASCEALCRWDHPELGPVSPAVFIPLAEEMGIISDISTIVLEQATSECMKWPEEIGVSVNLSAKDFHSREVVDKVRAALAKSGLAAHRLEIEVTETALLDDKSSTGNFLAELKSLGVRIALDDFGTGYSSLSYLHTLPLDKVKIDRSFLLDITHNSRSLELLKGVVGLSRGIGLQVTMEGVETFDQIRVLSANVRPDLVQGFLFGSALTASGIETMSNVTWPFAKELRKVSNVIPL
ncbi:MAG: EAL domain-containing protein [Rhizobiaceae bacterium]|nr:EAL domain-containing protein [Rhizobiaceae bacterium]